MPTVLGVLLSAKESVNKSMDFFIVISRVAQDASQTFISEHLAEVRRLHPAQVCWAEGPRVGADFQPVLS